MGYIRVTLMCTIILLTQVAAVNADRYINVQHHCMNFAHLVIISTACGIGKDIL